MKRESKRIAPGSKVLRGRESAAPAAPRSSVAIFGMAAAGIAALIGILLLLRSRQADPAKIKAELKAKVDEVNQKFGDAQVIEKDAALHPLLEVSRYQHYGGDVFAALEKEHRRIHEAAELQKAADAECPAWFKEADAVLGDANAPDDRVVVALEKGRSLWNKYGQSQSGSKLKETMDRLRQVHVDHEKTPPGETWLEFRQHCIDLMREGKFVETRDRIAQYGDQHHPETDQVLADNLDGLRNQNVRNAAKYAKDLLERATRMRQNGQEAEAGRMVAESLPHFEGFEAQTRLKEFLR